MGIMSIEKIAPALKAANLMTPEIQDCMDKRQAIRDKWQADWETQMEAEYGPNWRTVLREMRDR